MVVFGCKVRLQFRQSDTDMERATVYTLARFRWDYFGTLTFRSARVPLSIQVYRFLRVVRALGGMSSVKFKNLRWALRLELGEIGGRPHFHFLLGGFPSFIVDTMTCAYMRGYWEGLGGGMARVRLYSSDAFDSGVEYLLKSLGCSSQGGMNQYELRKFGRGSVFHSSGDDLIVSDNVWRGDGLTRLSPTCACDFPAIA
jgi:hypothetical protein